jgi:hypothetical protein
LILEFEWQVWKQWVRCVTHAGSFGLLQVVQTTTELEIEGNCFVVLKHLLVAGLFAMPIPQELMSYGQGFPW